MRIAAGAITVARRRARLVVLALVVAVGAAELAPRPAHGDTPGAAAAVVSVALTVADLERSVAFFTDVLGFESAADVAPLELACDAAWSLRGARARTARLHLGREHVVLIAFTPARGRVMPVDSRSNDRWFQHLAIVVSDMAAAHARLTAYGVRAISTAPQTLPRSNPAAAGITAFYFTDPDGHPLELIQYPPGKGDPRWQDGAGRLFLGIDHTAIAVADTDASLAFYRDRLGLRVVGESRNVGIEQERLTGVPGASVRITGLRAPDGPPGVELLEYRAPRDGRRIVPEARVDDLVHWHTTVAVAGRDPAVSGRRTIAPTVVSAAGTSSPSPCGLLVRDPDGHALELVGR